MGTEKGKILEDLIAGRSAISPVTHVLELGTFCGYCTIRLARSLPASATIVTVEKDEKTFDVARQIIGRAGLLEDPEFASYAQNAKASGLAEHAKINMYLGSSGDLLPELRGVIQGRLRLCPYGSLERALRQGSSISREIKACAKGLCRPRRQYQNPRSSPISRVLVPRQGYQTWRTSVIDVALRIQAGNS